jgi:hypothetical protein
MSATAIAQPRRNIEVIKPSRFVPVRSIGGANCGDEFPAKNLQDTSPDGEPAGIPAETEVGQLVNS